MKNKWITCLFLLSPMLGAGPVYFNNFPGATATAELTEYMVTEAVADGIDFHWENRTQKKHSASIGQSQYLEDLTTLSFELTISFADRAALAVELSDTDRGRWRAELPAVSGEYRIVLTAADFRRIGNGVGMDPALRAGAEVIQIRLVASGEPGAKLAGHFRNFTVCGRLDKVKLFEPEEFRDIFGRSDRFAPAPICFASDRVPRVFVAEGTMHLASTRFQKAVADLAKEFPGQLGVHFNGHLFARISDAVRFYNSLGIKTTFENHLTGGYQDFLTNRKLYMTRYDGFTMSDPGCWEQEKFRFLWPYHGFTAAAPAAFLPVEKTLDQTRRNGLSEYLCVDYIWPWHGRWGYDDLTVTAFRRDLAGTDDGLMLASAPGEYRRHGFRDYLKLFTEIEFHPEMIGLKDWNEYRPVTESVAAAGSAREKCNLFLFFALYHYEYLKFLQKVGDAAAARGIGLVAGSNPEDIYNGNDHYLAARVRGVAKLGYEFFGSPGGTYAWYHNMRFFSGNLRRFGKQIYLIGELNNGGHGKTKYSPEAAYAFYYDATSAAKPSDYNNQYMETAWNGAPPESEYHRNRYGHWAAGAYAFLQSHRENGELPAPKRLVVIASRNILEMQSGFSAGMKQWNNPSQFLDELHFPFDAAGKEGLFDGFADAADVMFYAPAESGQMHLDAAEAWLDARPGRLLITHSTVPFARFDGTVNLKRGTREVIWRDGESYNRFLDELRVTNSSWPLELDRIDRNMELSFAGLRIRRDLYRLKNAEILLADAAGTPLLSEIKFRQGRIWYLHVSFPFGAGDEFNRILLDRVMRLAGEKPEALADPSAGIHLYSVPGGKSAVIWDTPAIAQMTKARFFDRLPLVKPRNIAFPAEAGRRYQLYEFYSDQISEQIVAEDGLLQLKSAHSCDLYYFGPAEDPAFEKTLAAVRIVREKLRLLTSAKSPDKSF